MVSGDAIQTHSKHRHGPRQNLVHRRRRHRGDEETCAPTGLCLLIDPPYTVAGKRAGSRLYTHFELDHEDLFRQCEKTKGDFLLTYDTADEVVAMAKSHGLNVDTVSMKNTHHSTMKELVIARDLAWVRD
jgi:hypothetical protein